MVTVSHSPFLAFGLRKTGGYKQEQAQNGKKGFY
jgi:hypothetical protein